MKKHLRPFLTDRSALRCWLRLAAIILLVPSCVASAVTLTSYGYSPQQFAGANSYQISITSPSQYVDWTKISLLSSPYQENDDNSRPELSQKVKVENAILTLPDFSELKFSGLDEKNTTKYSITGIQNPFRLTLYITNKTDKRISAYIGFVIHYKALLFYYTTSLGLGRVNLPPTTTCSVNVVPSVYVTMKTNESSQVSAKIASDMKQGKLKLSPDHIQGGEGVLVNGSGLAGPTYRFPDATLDAGNQSWQWVPDTEGANLNIVFPSVNNRGIAAGEYRGILTATLSCR